MFFCLNSSMSLMIHVFEMSKYSRVEHINKYRVYMFCKAKGIALQNHYHQTCKIRTIFLHMQEFNYHCIYLVLSY